jgi:hypothetical protein
MSLFGFIRVGMKREKMDADIEELKLKVEKDRIDRVSIPLLGLGIDTPNHPNY